MSMPGQGSWEDTVFGGNTADPSIWNVGTSIYDAYNKNKQAKDAKGNITTGAGWADPIHNVRGPAGDMYLDTLRNPQNYVNSPEMRAFDEYLQRSQLAKASAGGVRGSSAPERLAQREREGLMQMSNFRKDIGHLAQGNPGAAGATFAEMQRQSAAANDKRDSSFGTAAKFMKDFLAGQFGKKPGQTGGTPQNGMQQLEQILKGLPGAGQAQLLELLKKMGIGGGGLGDIEKVMRGGVPGVGGMPNMDDWSGSNYPEMSNVSGMDNWNPGAENLEGLNAYMGGAGGFDPGGYGDMSSFLADGMDYSSLLDIGANMGDFGGLSGTATDFMSNAGGGAGMVSDFANSIGAGATDWASSADLFWP